MNKEVLRPFSIAGEPDKDGDICVQLDELGWENIYLSRADVQKMVAAFAKSERVKRSS